MRFADFQYTLVCAYPKVAQVRFQPIHYRSICLQLLVYGLSLLLLWTIDNKHRTTLMLHCSCIDLLKDVQLSCPQLLVLSIKKFSKITDSCGFRGYNWTTAVPACRTCRLPWRQDKATPSCCKWWLERLSVHIHTNCLHSYQQSIFHISMCIFCSQSTFDTSQCMLSSIWPTLLYCAGKTQQNKTQQIKTKITLCNMDS